MRFIIEIKIILNSSHTDRDTLRQISRMIYARIFSSSMEIHLCGVRNFSIEKANSATESLRSGESAVTVTCFISAKAFVQVYSE